MSEAEVYKFYNDNVKVVYSEIEARVNTLPVELLFEIHAALDHLKRFHIDGLSEEKACSGAFSHFKRGLLDAYKLKLKYFNEDVERYLEANGHVLGYIDNGEYAKTFYAKRLEPIKTAKAARMAEGNKDTDRAFDAWESVSLMINEFERECLDYTKTSWAKAQYSKAKRWELGVSFAIGVIASLAASYLVPLLLGFIGTLV